MLNKLFSFFTPRYQSKQKSQAFIAACSSLQSQGMRFFAILKDKGNAHTIAIHNGNNSSVVILLNAEEKAHAALRYKKNTDEIDPAETDEYGNHPIIAECYHGGFIWKSPTGEILGAVGLHTHPDLQVEVGAKLIALMNKDQ